MLILRMNAKINHVMNSSRSHFMTLYIRNSCCINSSLYFGDFIRPRHSFSNQSLRNNLCENDFFQIKRRSRCFYDFNQYKKHNRKFHKTYNNWQNIKHDLNTKKKSTLLIISAIGILVLGGSYAAVPLYRIFCQAYSFGGTVQDRPEVERVASMNSVKEREISIKFTADAAAMVWNFKPDQYEIKVHPGETALAFYIAKNPTDKPVIGISTYNVLPFEAGQYFTKIQCFCFEEQMLNPHEEVHMPVFFYIDPDFTEDPRMERVDEITLSYTFFEAKEGMSIPLPGFMR